MKWIKDSFTFARTINDLNPEATFLCSFDISSLFTNIPLDETINICAETSYNSNLTSPSFFKDTFCQVMLSATKSVEFSFDHIMYQQIDSVSKGSPLRPALANILVRFYKHLLLKTPLSLLVILDTCMLMALLPFSVIKRNATSFLKNLILHTRIWFYTQKKINNSLLLLDILVKNLTKFFTLSSRKLIFKIQYTRWNSFGPKKRIRTKFYLDQNFIGTLIQRAFEIFSPEKLSSEVRKIKNIFPQNGYPKEVNISGNKKKILNSRT